jgi:hypothetical protein
MRRLHATIVVVEKQCSIILVQSECVFVALVTQREISMRHVVVYGLPRSTIIFHVIS